MSDEELERIIQNPRVIRNRSKVYSVRLNAIGTLNIQKEFGSFDAFLWGFVHHASIDNRYKKREDVPVKTAVSDDLSSSLKKRGFKFVGTTIMYAFMQAVGMVNDHLLSCPIRRGK